MSDPRDLKTRKKYRVIIELRYPPLLTAFDKRGEPLTKLHSDFKHRLPHWRTGNVELVLADDLEAPARQVAFTHQRASISLEPWDTFRQLTQDISNLFGTIFRMYGGELSTVDRIGARLLCVHEMPNLKNFESIKRRFQTVFLRQDGPFSTECHDLRLVIATKQRTINVGPVKKGEPWLKGTFRDPEKAMPDAGLGLDIDSFATAVKVGDETALVDRIETVLDLSFTTEDEILKAISVGTRND